MTIDEHIKATEHLLACQKAFKDGKVVTHMGVRLGGAPSWNGSPLHYEIVAAPKLRPWKTEDVPVGAVIRNKNTGAKFILAERYHNVMDIEDRYEWCWPHEQFDESKWKLCGVVES